MTTPGWSGVRLGSSLARSDLGCDRTRSGSAALDSSVSNSLVTAYETSAKELAVARPSRRMVLSSRSHT
jgi:hypothetical protein